MSMFFSSCMSVDPTNKDTGTLVFFAAMRYDDVLGPIFRDRCSCGLCYCRSSQPCSATMFGRFAHCRTPTTLGLTRNIAPLPCCSDSHTPMLRVCLFRYQAVWLPPVSVSQSRSEEQHTWCSHCVSRVACRLRARVVVVDPPTAS